MIRQVVGPALALLAGASLLAAAAGLPLFGDGGYYYFKLAVDGTVLVPNLRFTAVLPQLPGLAASAFTDDPLPLRLVFAVSYQSLPWLSLLACWLVVRRTAPWMLLFPLLSWVAVAVNFSAVSELLSGLYLVWPLVLAMALQPLRLWVRLYALVTAPLLLALHPVAFVLLFGLAAAAVLVAWRAPQSARTQWSGLAVWSALHGCARLAWTLVGVNAYERTVLMPDGMAHYLLTETTAQHLLLTAALLSALIAAAVRLLRPGPLRDGLDRWGLPAASALVALAALAVSIELVLGYGVKLKAALTFVAAALLMALAFGLGALRAGGRDDEPIRSQSPHLAYQMLFGAILMLLLAKSAAWWTATRQLQDVVASTDLNCVPFGPAQPYGLQWPWMNIVDDWVAPINALTFRPRVPAPQGGGVEPVALLLPGDGCRVLAATGEAYLADWIHRPWAVLDERFGPLRHAAQR